jgi:hypothetical protein
MEDVPKFRIRLRLSSHIHEVLTVLLVAAAMLLWVLLRGG